MSVYVTVMFARYNKEYDLTIFYDYEDPWDKIYQIELTSKVTRIRILSIVIDLRTVIIPNDR